MQSTGEGLQQRFNTDTSVVNEWRRIRLVLDAHALDTCHFFGRGHSGLKYNTFIVDSGKNDPLIEVKEMGRVEPRARKVLL